MSDWIALWLSPLEFWASYWRAVFAYRERSRFKIIDGGRHDPDIARRSPHYAAARVELEAASAKHGRGLTIGRVEDILLDHNLTMAHLIAILAKL